MQNPYTKETASDPSLNIESKVYTVTPMNQLIDINKTFTNFQADFEVASEGKKPFELLVIDQTSLDNNPEIPYKNVDTGEISGQISHDTNKFQNYYLILKSKEPCKCKVTIRIKEIPPKIQPLPPSQTIVQTPPVILPSEQNQSTSWFKILLIVLGVSVVAYVGYRVYNRKPGDTENQSESLLQNNPLLDRLKKLEIS